MKRLQRILQFPAARFNGLPEGQIDQSFYGWGRKPQKINSPF
jgi:hypothetical protein